MKLKDICPNCNEAKEMYYVPWCPRCDKPKGETKLVFNFLKCVYHLEATGHAGIKKVLWEYLCDRNIMKSNDSYMEIFFKTEEDDEDEDPKILRALKVLKESFDIKDDYCLFYVSW